MEQWRWFVRLEKRYKQEGDRCSGQELGHEGSCMPRYKTSNFILTAIESRLRSIPQN